MTSSLAAGEPAVAERHCVAIKSRAMQSQNVTVTGPIRWEDEQAAI
jgi:hypothetical protein